MKTLSICEARLRYCGNITGADYVDGFYSNLRDGGKVQDMLDFIADNGGGCVEVVSEDLRGWPGDEFVRFVCDGHKVDCGFANQNAAQYASERTHNVSPTKSGPIACRAATERGCNSRHAVRHRVGAAKGCDPGKHRAAVVASDSFFGVFDRIGNLD